MIFCMKVPYYKGKKRTRRFFRKNSRSFKNHKNVFLNDPEDPKKEVFGHFLEFALLDRLYIAYCDGTNFFHHLATSTGHEGPIKSH